MSELEWPDFRACLERNGVTLADALQSRSANQFLAMMRSLGEDVAPARIAEPLDEARRVAVSRAHSEYFAALPSQVQAIITQLWAADATPAQARQEIEKLQRG